MKLALVAFAFTVALAAGCSSAPKRAEAPSAAAMEAAPGAEPPPAAAPQQQGAPAADTMHVVTDWQLQFDQTLADADRLDCPNACRALGSLERSANNICGLVGEKTSTCVDVQKKREDAKSRVHERCGTCP